MANQNLNVCDFNKYGFCKFKSTCRKPHIMEICSNNGCETRVCSLRHPKSFRYFREIGYCKFGEWCLFKNYLLHTFNACYTLLIPVTHF